MSNIRTLILLAVAVVTVVLAFTDPPARGLWPPVAALAVIIVTRHALLGLLAGGFVGALLLAGGNPAAAVIDLFATHLWPSLHSSWKLGAIAFTLILGGFAAIMEAGGGLAALMRRAAGSGRDSARNLEAGAAGLGILCFFDGLANSMVVGRVSRDLADRAGTARVKLAYIVDSTSSAVACVAFVSTWIAFQLSLISEAFVQAGRPANPYAVFLESLPYNFYCWFTLVLLFVSIRQRFHPGPMGRFVAELDSAPSEEPVPGPEKPEGGPVTALAPLAVLMVAFFVLFVALGSPRPVFPLSRDKIVAAFGSDAGPLVLVLASVAATVAAALMFPSRPHGRWNPVLRSFGSGVRTMVGPIFILLAAWIMSSVIGELGTAALISRLATETGTLALMPTLTFLTGAAISFATGTSWGTMGLLFPLAVPAAAGMGAADSFLAVIVAAVFSGAVFGDHCSPFSDTTIVTSISCGVEPHDHVRTQIPYALITAAVAVGCGFLPAGWGFPGVVSLIFGAGILLLLPRLAGRR
ncbi:MAG: Na+/H+ antiporter NhaC family protein [Candidatus Krumholzibacteriota bacterium]